MFQKKYDIFLFLLAFLCLMIPVLYFGRNYYLEHRPEPEPDPAVVAASEEKYEEAISAIENKEYWRGIGLLKGMEIDVHGNRDILLNYANVIVHRGSPEEYSCYKILDTFPEDYTGPLEEEIAELRKQAADDKEAAERERAAFWAQLEREEAARLRKEYGGKPPVKGMRYEYLKYTSWGDWGEPDETEVYNFKNGKGEEVTAYYHHWYRDDGRLKGTIDVNPDGIISRVGEYDYSSKGLSGGTGHYSRSDDPDEDDPYDVYDYDDPEDFYYDNYDDFEDIEDAEDYWDEHH